ncbi:MAG TPA: GTPase Era [Bryobacteraceae bacterium]|nr:GTPase Era [Bryobacteraceae bacterium]
MSDPTTSTRFVSGFVSLLGRPNAGKSTLLNALVGAKIAIVAPKPQTTRTLIQGVLSLPGAQVIFVDTPGIHKPDTLFNRKMLETVSSALQERDLLVYVADAEEAFGERDEEALKLLEGAQVPVLLALNKIDKVKDKSQILPLIERYKSLYAFAEYIPISARTLEGLDWLRAAILERLPEGPEYYPSDYITDQPERFIASEIIREKILAETRQEVPHSVAVLVDRWEETPNLARIAATIYVEREGQKGILIGARGAMLKEIGTRARLEMERMFGRKVFLELFVRVQPKWRENPGFLQELDWRSAISKNE